MKILIGTPTYDKSVTVVYLTSLLRLMDYFRRKYPQVEFQVMSVSTALVTHARNTCASTVLQEPSYTHLLFIDADMGFSPKLIEKMIGLDKPVTGCVYPKRGLDYSRFHAVSRQVTDHEAALHQAQDYVGGGAFLHQADEPNPGSRPPRKIYRLRNGFVRVDRAGTGIMLIKREVFDQIKLKYPELWVDKCGSYYEGMGLKGGVLQCFECFAGDNGLYVGEDFAFCDRWVQGCEGEIWSCIDETITHFGSQEFQGQYFRKLTAQENPEPEKMRRHGSVPPGQGRRVPKSTAAE